MNWLNKKVNVKDVANKQEKDTAKRLGGKRQPMSGSLFFAKGDLIIEEIACGDCKFTDKKSYTLKSETWRRIKEDAFNCKNLIPFLQIEMAETEKLIVLSENDFIELIQTIQELRSLQNPQNNI